jgi:PTH1 family peptidyl-tRNA hydrolase
MSIALVLGLGNIGPKYVGTRHNLGFEVVSEVARQLEATPLPSRPNYESALIPANAARPEPLILALPTTLMNRSGWAASDLIGEITIEPSQMLVISDDVNLPLGALRFRSGGTDGGHNGLVSIIEHLETEEFPRLRLGIGSPADKEDRAVFVLDRFSEKERPEVERMVAKAAEAVIFAVTHRLPKAMAQFNHCPASPE